MDGGFDYLLIKPTGISESAPVEDTFAIGDRTSLLKIAKLNTMVNQLRSMPESPSISARSLGDQ